MRVAAGLAGLLLAAVLALPPIGPELWLRWKLWSLRHRPAGLFLQAEFHYERRDVEKARTFAEAARRVDPGHAGAFALLCELDLVAGRSEIRTCLGREAGAWTAHGSLIEIDAAHARGTQAFQRGDLTAAETECRKILEYAKWVPMGAELNSRCRQAQELLDRIEKRRKASP